jgi:autotransporter-associated beta strand protein
MNPRLTKAPGNALQLHIGFTPASSNSSPRLARKTFLQTILAVAISILAPMVAHAGSATWDLNPGSGDWNTAGNWTPATVPNGPADVATFALSNTTFVSLSANTEVDSVIFTPAATNPYNIGANSGITLTLSGTGITNNSGIAQSFFFNEETQMLFTNSASAGNATIFHGDSSYALQFSDRSTAGSATIQSGVFALVNFFNTSTAGNALIGSPAFGNGIHFYDDSSAGGATLVGGEEGSISFFNHSSASNATMFGSQNEGSIDFNDSSTAGSATVHGFGTRIIFSGLSEGGTAAIELLFDGADQLNSSLDISVHNAPGVTIGSLEADADFPPDFPPIVFLGANNLTVGSNNLSTTFSGVIQDEGSLTKIGKGILDLTGANTYTGVTNINGGVLKVDGSISSNTFVNRGGVLAGIGTVNGNVTNNAGEVSPGDVFGGPGVLTAGGNYTQTRTATLSISIGGPDVGQASVLDVRGNANLNGSLDPVLLNGFVPAIGQSFTFLNYASLTGSFSHIQNSVFDRGRKRWLVAYNSTSAVLTVIRNGR